MYVARYIACYMLIATSLHFRPRMGVLQHRYIRLQKMRWCTQIYGSTYLEGEALEVGQVGGFSGKQDARSG